MGRWPAFLLADKRHRLCRINTGPDNLVSALVRRMSEFFFFLPSFCCPSVANAPNVLQPYWLILLPLDVPDLTTSLLLWDPSGQRWRCLWTFLFSNVPTFATSRLQEILAAKRGTTWARNGRWILPENSRLPRNIQGSFTCRKSTTWDRRLYFPSEGRSAENFFALKNPTASDGFEPATLGTKGQHATCRPPKPLCRSWKELVIPAGLESQSQCCIVQGWSMTVEYSLFLESSTCLLIDSLLYLD